MVVGKRTLIYKVVGNCRIRADVYGAFDQGARPVIMWIHGGALIGGHRGNINPDQLEMYIRAGYVLVSIDYRLAPETKLKAIIEDVKDACAWVRDRGSGAFNIDPDRIVVIGHSAGGYLALITGFCVYPRPKALVSFYGYGDITDPWYSRPDPFYCQQPSVSKEEAYATIGRDIISEAQGPNDRGRFYLYLRQNGLWPKEVAGHDPDKEPAAFDPFCPIRNVTVDYPPTLLLHGDMDTDVPYEQSVKMAEEFSRGGVEHEMITIPKGGHGFDGAEMKEPKVVEAFGRVFAFLERNIV